MSEPTEFDDRALSLALSRVTEQAAIAAADYIGRGDERAADTAAVDAMHRELSRLEIQGTIVVGEGAEGDAPKLYQGEVIGALSCPEVDIAADALEGVTLTAKDSRNAMSVICIAPRGSLMQVPEVYMDKLAIGPGYPAGTVSLDMSPAERVQALAAAKGCAPRDIVVSMLERPRHMPMLDELRQTGASVRLLSDGDVAGVLNVAEPDLTGIDMFMGAGGALEGVLAAAALKCLDGQFYGRLLARNDDERVRAASAGFRDLSRIYSRDELVRDHVIFAATGVTGNAMIHGIRRSPTHITTETLLMRTRTGSVRRMSYRFPRS